MCELPLYEYAAHFRVRADLDLSSLQSASLTGNVGAQTIYAKEYRLA